MWLSSKQAEVIDYTRSVDNKQLNLLIYRIMKGLGRPDGDLTGWQIQFTRDYVIVPRSDGWVDVADGNTNIDRQIITITILDPCLENSSLSHELAHLIHFWNHGDGDRDHRDKAWWELEKNLNKQLTDYYCLPIKQ